MKCFVTFLFAVLSFAFIGIGHAATESTNIIVDVTYDEYVNLIGTVVGSEKTFSVDDIKPPGNVPRPKLSLGMLGLSSNVTGDCTLTVTTLHNFKLRHTVSNKRLTRYKLFYKGNKFRKGKNTMTLPCSSALSNFKFKSVGKFRKKVKSGIYSDTVTLEVITQ